VIVSVALSGAVGLLFILIVMVATATTRSEKRLECARLRDELVDAARLGQIDVTEPRVFSLIDWFDRVAQTGRVIASGRHAAARPQPSALIESLTNALSLDRQVPVGPSFPAGLAWPDLADQVALDGELGKQGERGARRAGGERRDSAELSVRGRAERYQRRKLLWWKHSAVVTSSYSVKPIAKRPDPAQLAPPIGTAALARLKPARPRPRRQPANAKTIARQEPSRRDPRRQDARREETRRDEARREEARREGSSGQSRVDVTGHPKPRGALVPLTGPIPIPPPTLRPEWLKLPAVPRQSEAQPASSPASETSPTLRPVQSVTLKDEILSLPS
jgi:hypothetical protein